MILNPLRLLITGGLALLRLQAQSPGSFDTNYVTLPGTDSAPTLVIALPEGKVLTGGSFTNYGGSGRAGLVRLNAGGTVDASFAIPAPKLSRSVKQLSARRSAPVNIAAKCAMHANSPRKVVVTTPRWPMSRAANWWYRVSYRTRKSWRP